MHTCPHVSQEHISAWSSVMAGISKSSIYTNFFWLWYRFTDGETVNSSMWATRYPHTSDAYGLIAMCGVVCEYQEYIYKQLKIESSIEVPRYRPMRYVRYGHVYRAPNRDTARMIGI